MSEFSDMTREHMEELLSAARMFRPDFHLAVVSFGTGWKLVNTEDRWTFLLVGEWISTDKEEDYPESAFTFPTLWSAWQAGKRMRLKYE